MRRAACVLLWLGTAAGSRYHPVTPGDEVCVVITGYNTADTVGDAVASVLQQTHQNLKVVFVDDGSRDATRCAVEQELAGDDRDHAVIALPANTPGGVGTAANRGMDACPTTSNYVAFLDADDVMAKTALADLVGAAQKHDADIVLGDWFKFEQTTGKQLAPYDVKVTDSLPRDTAFTVAEHPQVLQTSPVPWRKLYGADYLRANDVKFPQGDHFFEDNAFHWRALTASPETTRLAYASVLVVAHTVGDARQTTAGIDGADAEKLGGYLPNLNAIARELVDERAPEYLLREFANFLSQSKWIVARQQDTRLQAKFSRILRRDAVLFVEAAAPEPGSLRNALKAEFEDDAYVKFFGEEPSPTVELSVVVPTKDVGGAQITELLASLTNVPLTTEIFVVDDGSTDDTLAAVDAFRGSRDDVYLLRETVSRGAGRARNRASPLLEGTYVVYIDADDQVDPQALAAAVHSLRADSDADLLFFPYAIEQSATPSGMWDSDQAAFARGVGAATPELRKAAALELTNYPWNRVARTDVLRGVQFGATRVHNDVRFHWTSIASARDVAFLDVDSKPAVIHRKGARQTLTDLSSSARLEVFAALAETRDSLGNAFLATNGPAFDRFARDLVVWAAPKIPLENKAEARDRCLDALGAEETATCERAFGAAGALQTPCEHLPSVPARAIRQLEMDSVAPNVYSFAYGWGSGAGWCDSDLDYEIGFYSGEDCWAQCDAMFGAELVAVDWDVEGYCYCQNDCRCMNDVGDPGVFLATQGSIAELPGPCSYDYSYSYSYHEFLLCPDLESAYVTCLETAAQNGVDASAGGWSCCAADASFPTTCAGMQTYYEFQDACGDPPAACAAEWHTYVECVYATALDAINDDLTGAAPLNCDLNCMATYYSYSYSGACTENCIACDGPGYEDCLECESGYAHYDADGDGGGSCWPECRGQAACYADGSSCPNGEFCNFDGGSSGDCEQCSSFSESAACYTDGLPDDGAVDCHACCFGGEPLYSYSYNEPAYSFSYTCSDDVTTWYDCLKESALTYDDDFFQFDSSSYAYSYGPPTTCDEAQQHPLFVERCAYSPPACQAEYWPYVECDFEYLLRTLSIAGCDLDCASAPQPTRAPTTSAPTTATHASLDFYEDAGWCVGEGTADDCDSVSDVACPNGEDAAAAAACWDACAARYGEDMVVSVDIDEGAADMEGECDCCCQTACACRTGIGVESFALPKGSAMPDACPYESYSYWPSYSYDFSFQLAAPAEAFCEGSGFGQAECESHACCHFDAGACWWSGFSCTASCPVLPFFGWLSCEDVSQDYGYTCDDMLSWGYDESVCAGCPACDTTEAPTAQPTTPRPTPKPTPAPSVTPGNPTAMPVPAPAVYTFQAGHCYPGSEAPFINTGGSMGSDLAETGTPQECYAYCVGNSAYMGLDLEPFDSYSSSGHRCMCTRPGGQTSFRSRLKRGKTKVRFARRQTRRGRLQRWLDGV